MSVFAWLNPLIWFGVTQTKEQRDINFVRAFAGSLPMSLHIKTDKCKELRVGMKVVLNEEWREYAYVKGINIPANEITLSLIIDKKYTQEEIDNFPLRVFNDTKQYLK